MFRHLLLPVDLTDKNQAAIAIARGLSSGAQAKITLLHVIETIADAPFEDLAEFYERLENKARKGMGDLAKTLEAADLAVQQRVIYGKRAPQIVSFAQEHEVDLIVLSSHPLDPDNPEAAWASISHQVAILSRCPVLLVK